MVDGILDASRLESDLIGVKREEQRRRPRLSSGPPDAGAARRRRTRSRSSSPFPRDSRSLRRLRERRPRHREPWRQRLQIRRRGWQDPGLGALQPGAKARSPSASPTAAPASRPEHVKLIFDRFQQIAKRQAAEQRRLRSRAAHRERASFASTTARSRSRASRKKGSTFAFTLPIFDVDSLIPLHFAFLKTSRHSFQKVSIATGDDHGRPDSPRAGGGRAAAQPPASLL